MIVKRKSLEISVDTAMKLLDKKIYFREATRLEFNDLTNEIVWIYVGGKGKSLKILGPYLLFRGKYEAKFQMKAKQIQKIIRRMENDKSC
jgi:hypothetical protein